MLADIAAVVEVAPPARVVVKVILETALLTRDGWKEQGCRLAEQAGAQFVKTSTGFGGGGATVEASAGIRDWPAAQKMIEAGATRLGCSSSVAIMRGFALARGGE